MRALYLAVLAMGAGLASCGPGVDDPENLPQMGNWQETTSLVSASVDGAAIDPSKLPKGMPKLGSKSACGEPTVRTNEEFLKIVNAKILKNCKLTPLTKTGTQASLSGSCVGPKVKGMDTEMAIDLRSIETENSMTIDFSGEIYVFAADGGTSTMAVEYQRDFKRLGDC